MSLRYAHADPIQCTADMFAAAGLDQAIAGTVAEILVEADLLGYATHGLQFVPAYMKALEAGKWTTSGEPSIVNDRGAALVLDANWLPGQWATVKALEMAQARLAEHPVVTVAMGHCHNISCLATYCRRAAEAGALMILTASAPGNAAVAPAGGRVARYSTSPFAAGIPTDGHPVLFDTATSATTNRMIERTRREGGRLAAKSLVDAEGRPSDDPEAFFAEPERDYPGGAILPAGGLEGGHKGFAWAILVEALTSSLTGMGRAVEGSGGNNVFLQLIDPGGFAGDDAFRAEAGHFAELCRTTPPMDEANPVRMPGDKAERMFAEQTANGVQLHPEILPRMAPFLEKYGIAAPGPR